MLERVFLVEFTFLWTSIVGSIDAYAVISGVKRFFSKILNLPKLDLTHRKDKSYPPPIVGKPHGGQPTHWLTKMIAKDPALVGMLQNVACFTADASLE